MSLQTCSFFFGTEKSKIFWLILSSRKISNIFDMLSWFLNIYAFSKNVPKQAQNLNIKRLFWANFRKHIVCHASPSNSNQVHISVWLCMMPSLMPSVLKSVHIIKNHVLCSSFVFVTTWVWVNYDLNFWITYNFNIKAEWGCLLSIIRS